MKHIYLVRHAKSDWSNSSLSDYDRPLNHRGLKDAPFMANLLKNRVESIDMIISSPANRAITTAKYFAKEFGEKTKKILSNEELYLPDYHTIVSVLKNLDDKIKHVMIVTHNPAITEAANYLTGRGIDNIPTCGIAGLIFESDHWSKIDKKKCELDFFDFPKKYI